ncbi:MAG: GatB/YqeY domain-containing protein [bacterium]
MDLTDRLEADLISAAKARDEIKLQVLRLLKSSLKNYQIEVKQDLTPQQALQILQKEAKKRQESIDQFTQADRLDLADQETKELAVLKEYLPSQPEESEVRDYLTTIVQQESLEGPSAMGRLIKEARDKYEGIDGSLASRLAKEVLGL